MPDSPPQPPAEAETRLMELARLGSHPMTADELRFIAGEMAGLRAALAEREQELEQAEVKRLDALILGDGTHPHTRDYIATNLLAVLALVPNTGDWHGQVRMWCEANSSGKLAPNPMPHPPGLDLSDEEIEALLETTDWAEKFDQEEEDYGPAWARIDRFLTIRAKLCAELERRRGEEG